MIIGGKKGRSVSLSCRLQCPVPSSNHLQLSFIEKNKLPLGKLHQLHDKPRRTNACWKGKRTHAHTMTRPTTPSNLSINICGHFSGDNSPSTHQSSWGTQIAINSRVTLSTTGFAIVLQCTVRVRAIVLCEFVAIVRKSTNHNMYCTSYPLWFGRRLARSVSGVLQLFSISSHSVTVLHSRHEDITQMTQVIHVESIDREA